jgi:NTE family protein
MAGTSRTDGPAPRIGLALGAGGARGWCHIGVLAALDDLGLRPSVVAGCSMGALVGAAIAGGRVDALSHWARTLTARGVLRYMDMRIFRGGLVEGGQITNLLERIGLPERIEDLALPYAAVATDLQSGGELWFRSGPLNPAVRGSTAVPGVFNPYYHDGRWLIDGALINPVPVSAARALGADVVIAIDPNATCGRPMWSPAVPERASQTLMSRIARMRMVPRILQGVMSVDPSAPAPAEMPALPEADAEQAPSADRPPGYFEVLGTAIDIMQVSILQQRLARDPPEIRLDADLKHVGILELYRADEAIAHGHDMVMARADELRALSRQR